jgi:hypothetical protein
MYGKNFSQSLHKNKYVCESTILADFMAPKPEFYLIFDPDVCGYQSNLIYGLWVSILLVFVKVFK